MQPLFIVLGIIFGLVAGFAITYFAFVGKLQKKLASAKKKLDRAQSANEDTENLQSQLTAQQQARLAAESQLASLEGDRQAQISDLEAQHAAALQDVETSKAAIEAELSSLQAANAAMATELETLRQNSVPLDQLPPDNSEELAALQARLAEMEQQHQAALQAVETGHQAELETLRQSLTTAPPPPVEETELETVAEAVDELPAPDSFEFPSPELDLMEEVTPEVESDEIQELAAAELTVSAESEPSPFEQFDQVEQQLEEQEVVEAVDEASLPDAFDAETETPSPFDLPDVSAEEENWVDAPADGFEAELETEESPSDVLTDLEEETPSPFELAPEPAVETDNWVDAPDTPDLASGDLDLELSEIPATDSLEMDDLLSEAGDADAFTAELPELEAEDSEGGFELPELEAEDSEGGFELPEMADEADLGDFDFGEQSLDDLGSEDSAPGDDFLAELTGTDEEEVGLELLGLEETAADTGMFEEELALPSDPGDTMEMPDSFLADIPSFNPDESETEDISEVGMGSDDDLDFLLQLQDDEPPPAPSEEFLPEFNDDEAMGSGFQTMELLADDNAGLSNLLGEDRPPHEGDPFINILDESPDSSDNDLLALLQDDEGGGAHQQEGDDDLFSGLEGMLNTDTPDNESDLNDLDALLNSPGDAGSGQDDAFSFDDLGLGEDKH